MAVMMTIPDAMRLPLTFGLSGALHVAAMSGFEPPPSAAVAEHPLQVLLFEGNLARAAGPIAPGAPAAGTARKPDPQPADDPQASMAASSSPTPAATPAVELPPVDAVTTPATAVAAPPPGMAAERAPDSAPPEPAASSDAPPSTRTRAVETRAAAAASDPPGIGAHPVPGVPVGTLASPLPAPKALRTPAPEYPEEARWEKRTGLATLGFRVEADGSVAEVRMLHSSGHADLDAAALESLRHWRFTLPAGAAPSSWYRYVFRFELT